MKNKKTSPIKNKENIAQHPDNKIDQDFPGFPHAPSSIELIQPKTEEQKKSADIKNKDGEKAFNGKNEQQSIGSGRASVSTKNRRKN